MILNVTILSEDSSGIESLVKLVRTNEPFTGFSGKGFSVLRKMRRIFGSTTVKEIHQILSQNPELIDRLNRFGEFKVHYGPS
jgi:hypothetical protein